jgi:hypothetical protein
MWPIVRKAFADASPGVRGQFRAIAGFWLAILALQIWDSRNASGAAGVAEFLSALLGATGIALLGVAHTLQRTMEEASIRHAPSETQAVQQVLRALPPIGFAAGAALCGAAVLMLLRALLGAELLLAVVGGTLYAGAVLVAARTVNRSVRTLYAHAVRNAEAAANARSEAAAAQLSALQARMNPHFLFNALNTVAALVRTEPAAAERVVEDLSDVLRRTLERSAASMSTVREEVDYVRAYLALEQQRFGPRLRVEWDVAPEALDALLPPLVLQPLAENALRHGLGSRIEGGTIRLIADVTADRLVIAVEDDGNGFSRGWREGTGLGNLRQRLATTYGSEGTLTVSEHKPGSRVAVEIPLAASSAASAVTG